jgi:predicted flap endonuclease-1-like 5' DNA nuclease
MNKSSNFIGSLAIAALFGLVAWLTSNMILNINGIGSIIIGLIVLIIIWIVLLLGLTKEKVDQSASELANLGTVGTRVTGINRTSLNLAPGAALSTDPDSTTIATDTDLHSVKADIITEKTPAPAAKVVKPAEKKAVPTKPKDAKAPLVKTTPVAADGKPVTLTSARAAGADDLKLLKGVGPALEKNLNELGFYHFDQVAGWRKAEVEWVDSRVKFKGRIVRDEWIKQAKALAKGGTTGLSKSSNK